MSKDAPVKRASFVDPEAIARRRSLEVVEVELAPRSTHPPVRRSTAFFNKKAAQGAADTTDTGGSLFGGLRALQGRQNELLEQLKKKPWDVRTLYKTVGPGQRVARSFLFDNVTMLVITFNAVWIGVDEDYNKAPSPHLADPLFMWMDNFFCAYFTGEVMVRFIAFKVKHTCLKDNWFKFDSVLVAVMIFETWLVPMALSPPSSSDADGDDSGGFGGQLALFRLLRLLRLSRMVRLMRAMPELVTMIKGMMAALRSVGSTLFLLSIGLYVLGIICTSQLENWEPGAGDDPLSNASIAEGGDVPHRARRLLPSVYVAARRQLKGGGPIEGMELFYSTVLRSALTLFTGATLGDDIGNLLSPMFETGMSGIVFIYFFALLVTGFTLLNMLIGVVNEVVSATCANEELQFKAWDLRDKLQSVFEEEEKLDPRASSRPRLPSSCPRPSGTEESEGAEVGMVTADIFDRMLQSEKVEEALDYLGIEKTLKHVVSSALFQTEDGPQDLPFDQFLFNLASLSPNLPATVMHRADFQTVARTQIKQSATKVDRGLADIYESQHRMFGILSEWSPAAAAEAAASGQVESSRGISDDGFSSAASG